jgi:predicted ester cyclase
MYIEHIWNRSRLDLIPDLFSPGYIIHTPNMLMPVSYEDLKEDISRAKRTFPDMRMSIEHMVAEGDKVVVHWTTSGTHLGEFTLPGMPVGLPPSGNRVTFSEVGVYRVENGRIAEAWIQADVMSMLQQVGAIPPSGPPETPVPPDPEANKRLFRRLVDEVWNGRNLDVLDELYAPDATSPNAPQLPPGPTGVKIIAQAVFNGFPDYHMGLERMVAEGDMVSARFIEQGTHRGDFMGIPPTNKYAEWTEIGTIRVRNGKIAQTWFETDMMTMLQGLGVIPAPQQD